MRAGALALLGAFLGFVTPLGLGCEGESSFLVTLFDAGPPDARYEASCGVWARDLCAAETACFGAGPWTDAVQCVARETIRCELLANDPNVVFDATLVAQCVEPDAGNCAAPFGSLCLPSGRAALGAACLSSEACASGYCAYAFDSTGNPDACGTCRSIPCGGSCPTGRRCDYFPDGGADCVPIVGPGEPCSAQGDCQASYYCGPAKTCAPLADLGDACGDGLTGPPCGDSNQYCDGTGHCRAYVSAPYGAPCGIVGTDAYLCAGSGTCDPTDGQCLPPASDGEVCDDNQGLGCLPPARCLSNRCVFPSMEACASSPGRSPGP